MTIIAEWLAGSGGPARSAGTVPVGSMTSGMAIELPYVAVRGAQPGKTLWLNGQVHGDEINGMIAALRFANSLDPATMSGNVVVTPTANPHALDSRRKRNPYDDLDLDQSFPGNGGGLISERLAHALFEEICAVADCVVNLHTMNALFDSRPYTVYKLHPDSGIDEQTLLRAMAPFSPHVACRMDVGGKGELPGNIAGALDYQCLQAGIAAFMLELGGGSRFEADCVALAERGFLALARQMGIVAGPIDTSPTQLRRVTRRGWITANVGGLFVADCAAGEQLKASALLGRSINLAGATAETVAVPQDGIVIGLRRDPVVHTGERLAFMAWQWDTVTLEPLN